LFAYSFFLLCLFDIVKISQPVAYFQIFIQIFLYYLSGGAKKYRPA
jgi:hypothetical protein